jgi:hypothetical protein
MNSCTAGTRDPGGASDPGFDFERTFTPFARTRFARMNPGLLPDWRAAVGRFRTLSEGGWI